MNEKWLPVPGHEMYEVSDAGRIRSLHRYHGQDGPRILAQVRDRKGYLAARFDGTNWYAHRLVMLAFVGPLPSGMVTRHLDGDHDNNRLSNLRYGTQRENNLDAVRHGRNANARKTHCKRGHEFTAENTRHYTHANGNPARACLTCVRAGEAARYLRVRAERKSAA